MPNRRSRLQDYYEQLLGPKPSDGGTDQDAEETSARPEQDPVFPWLIPQPQPEPEPDVTPVTPMINIVSNNPPDETGGSTVGQAPGSDFGGQGSTGSTQMEELPDIEKVQENRIDPADIKFYLAAQENSVLNDIRLMCQHEGIPMALTRYYDRLLSLCAEYGIDEENDAEARDYLDHIKNGGSSHQNTDDPLFRARREALNAFGTDNAVEAFNAYQAAVEEEFGVEFTVAENADEWNLANIVMAHAALEMAASVFGERLRDMSGLDIDDATAFQLIFGPLTINHSTVVKMTAHAEVFGSLIEVYWKRKEGDDRNYNFYPFVLLHELGHRFNLLAGLGVRDGYGSLSINENFDHPRSRDGMGQSAHRQLYEFVDVPAYHGMYDAADLKATHVELLQYGELSDHNEVTADAVLNWIVHQATGGVSGFADTAEGQDWLEFMDKNMDAWIKNAIVYNAHRQGVIASLAEEGLIDPIAGTGTVIVGEDTTATVRSTHSQGGAEMAHLRRGEEVLLLGESEPDDDGYRWNAVWANDIYWVRFDLIRETWTERHPMTEEKANQWFPTLLELLTRR
ncbi:MAG: hypothetical protein OXG78_03620 [Chloroflexi bacterium]|nr:hypothetical protein [Chloroflexota bacterium]